MIVEVHDFLDGDAETWDTLCDGSLNATFLHKRLFTSYHGDRFEDKSLVIELDGKPVGVLPAARHLRDPKTVISHPGLTYGGIVHGQSLTGQRMLDALVGVAEHYKAKGFERFIYKPVPHIYHRSPAQDDLYGLFRLGAVRMRCDLSVAIDLGARLKPSSRRRRSFKKASKLIKIESENQNLPAFWDVVSDNLKRKHGASPVHSLDEITMLADRFPNEIQLYSGSCNDALAAGVLVFKTPTVWHAQYIASSAAGYETNALDAVFENIIQEAAGASMRFFDFGICNENNGLILNDDLYRFKSEFGGGGVVYEQYEIDLTKIAHT